MTAPRANRFKTTEDFKNSVKVGDTVVGYLQKSRKTAEVVVTAIGKERFLYELDGIEHVGKISCQMAGWRDPRIKEAEPMPFPRTDLPIGLQ